MTRRKRLGLRLLALLTTGALYSCAHHSAPPISLNPKCMAVPDFLKERGPRTAVTLVGTFHFAYPQRDEYKSKFFVDVLSPQRQQEVEELVALLSNFQPTTIAIESDDQRSTDSAYNAYRAGHRELTRNETEQIGFRLAARLGLRRIYAIDASSRSYYPKITDSTYASHVRELGPSDTTWDAKFLALYRFDDSLTTVLSLRHMYAYMNSPERLREGHGNYLVGDFKLSRDPDYFGPDIATRWWNRNLRIFNNVQHITNSTSDRILVLIGAGHVPLLKHAFESSPEYRYIEVNDYLTGRRVSSPSETDSSRESKICP